MGDSTRTLTPSTALITSYTKGVGSLSSPVNSQQTLDRHLSYRCSKVDTHATARMLFDNLARESDAERDESKFSESKKEGDVNNDNPLMSTEVLEDSEETLLSPTGVEAITLSESSSPGDNNVNDIDDETNAWISCNQSGSESSKSLPSVTSSSSSWSEDAYEKPSMVGAGLENLGNTCFFNAVMQCFTHSVLLVQGLYSNTHPTPCDCSGDSFCLICALREHIELSLLSTGKSVSPWKFVDNLSYFSSSFLRYQQEDAHELLQCFLDRLDSCLTDSKPKDPALPSHTHNLVKQVFGGRVISKLRCCNCNHISDTYEPSVDLSLEIEDACSLSTALESFTKVEHIEDEEMKFTCDHCKQKVSVEKQLMLDEIPPICTFHLKRFKNDGSYVEKIDKPVEFPLELNLKPYISDNHNNNVDFSYELYAVVVHAGYASSSGHYYCYIRSAPDKWYKFDDRKVICVPESDVLSEEAYILFYAKQGTPWFSNFMETFKPSFITTMSNTSPKSVLENVDPPNILPQSDDVVAPYKPVSNVIKENSPLTVKEYGSNRRTEAETNTKTSKFDSDEVLSPSTPPSYPEFDFSDDDDENSSVVFAVMPEQLKLVEKATPTVKRERSNEIEDSGKLVEKVTSTSKRQRDNEIEDSRKREAMKMCKRMGSRGELLLSAMLDGSKSPINNKPKKMGSSSRRGYSKSSDRRNRSFTN